MKVILGGICAINAKSLKTTFNKAVEDTAAMTFTTKRGTTNVVLAVTWNAEKTEATLTSTSNLVAGDYTVTVAGGDIATDANSGSVTVEAQKVASIEFIGTTLAKTGNDTGTIGFKVYDQYGTDVTKDATSLVSNIQWTASIATDSLVDASGVLTVDSSANFTDAQSFVLTALDSATGTTATVTVTTGDAATVQTFAFGDQTLPTGKTRIYTGSSTAVTIGVTATDQYGTELSTSAQITGVTLVPSDSTVVATFTDVDNKPVINVDTSALTTAKTVTINAIINATGQTASIVLDVAEPAKADAITIGDLETNIVAVGDVAGKIVFPITVTNQFGETLTADEIAAEVVAGDITVNATGSLASANMQIDTTKSSENYGKLVNTATNTDAAGVGTIIVSTGTGKTDSVNVTTKSARIVSEILAPTTITTNLVSGATSSFAYNYRDQYGDTVTPTGGNTNTALTWKFVVTDLTGDAGVITVNKATGTAEENIGTVTVTAVDGKTGTAKVSAQLLNASSEVVSQVETTFTVTGNSAAGLTYSIADIPTLYSDASAAENVTGSGFYAEPITVIATDTGGSTFAVPNNQIVSVQSVNAAFVISSGALGDVAIEEQDYKYVIGAEQSGSISFASGEDTFTDTLIVTLNTEDGVQVLEKDVVISQEAIATQDLKILDNDLDADDHKALPTSASELTAFEFTNRANVTTGTSAYVVKLDQYGRWTKVTGVDQPSMILNTTGLVAGSVDTNNGFEFDSDTFKLTEAVAGNISYKADTPIRYTIMDGTSTATFTVTITEEEPPAVNATPADKLVVNYNADTDLDAGDTVTLSFSEDLSADSQAAVIAEVTPLFDHATGTIVDLQGSTDASLDISFTDDKTLVITVGTGLTDVSDEIATSIIVSKENVIDVVGNAAVADLDFGALADED